MRGQLRGQPRGHSNGDVLRVRSGAGVCVCVCTYDVILPCDSGREIEREHLPMSTYDKFLPCGREIEREKQIDS